MRRRTAVRWSLRAAALLAAVQSSVAAADADYAPQNTQWNGAARLAALARELHLDFRASSVLDLAKLTRRTGLFVLGPRRPLPDAALRRFVREGGRLVVADDLGASAAFLERFGLTLTTPNATMGYGGRAALPIAYPRQRHLLTWGLDWLVTNHPSALLSRDRLPLISFGGLGGLLFAAREGEGELVALADPSVLTNQMLPFGDNEHFARALLRYVVRGTKARPLVYVHGDFEVRGELPVRLRPTDGAAALAHAVRELAEESAYGLNGVGVELMAQRPISGIFLALAVFAGGGALLLCAALWGTGVSVRLRGEGRPQRSSATPRLSELTASERIRLGAVLRAELEARLSQQGSLSREMEALREALRRLPSGEGEPLARRVSAKMLSRLQRRAEALFGPLGEEFARAPERSGVESGGPSR